MYKRYKDNHDYATKVDTFLTAGDHASVEKIFKSIGIDVSKSAAFDEGLDLLEADIDAFIKATK
jgi:oligoendopeptidase F